MNYKSEVAKMVTKCRKMGWSVEVAPANRGTDWSHQITCADGKKIVIHRTPRDPVVAIETKYRELNAHGFAEAMAAYQDGEERRRLQAIEEDRKKNDAKTERLERQKAAVAAAAGPYAPQPVHIGWLTTPSQWPETKTVIMTPAASAMVLEKMNNHNRRPSPSRVAYFEHVVEAGEFGCTHQGIAIDTNGDLIDGQSRLQAFVNTKKNVVVQVSIGMDPRTFAQVDTGSNRSGRDTAYIMGEIHPAEMAAATKMLIHIDDHGPEAHTRARKARISNDKLEQMMRKYGDPLRLATAQAKDMKKDLRRANASAMACAVYLIGQRLPAGDPRVDKFFDDLQEGNIPKGDVVWKLRQHLLNGPSTGRYYTAWETLALIIKTWNFRFTEKNVRLLAWRPGNEPFPAHIFLPPPLESAA